MANTGFDWETEWTVVASNILLTQGGDVQYSPEDDPSDIVELDLDIQAACLLSIDTDYSADALSGTGLVVTIRRDVNGTDWETSDAAAISFEMPFTNGGSARRAISLSASQFHKFIVQLDWSNATGGSTANTNIKVKYASIPVAS